MGHRNPLYELVLQCLFLNECSDPRIQHRMKLKNVNMSTFEHSTLLLKTTQFQQFDLLNSSIFAHNPSLVDDYFIIFLIRDPRAAWNSCRHHTNWKESNAQILCDKFMQMSNSLNALSDNIKVIGMYTKYIATLFPNEYRQIIYNFVGLSQNVSIQNDKTWIKKEQNEFGDVLKKIKHSNRWLGELNLTQIHQIQNIDSCRQWIKQFGYNPVNDTKDNVLMTVQQMMFERNPYPFPA